MANVPTPEFQKLWSNLIDSLRLEYKNTMQQHPDAVMKLVCGVLTDIAHLAECNPVSVGRSPNWTLIVQNIMDTRRNLHQLLKGEQLYSALYGVYTEVLHDLMAALKESTTKGETAKTTVTALLPIEKFHEERKQKWKHTDDANKRAEKPTTFTTGVIDPQLALKSNKIFIWYLGNLSNAHSSSL
jgi:hypothetical protein